MRLGPSTGFGAVPRFVAELFVLFRAQGAGWGGGMQLAENDKGKREHRMHLIYVYVCIYIYIYIRTQQKHTTFL